MIHDPLGPCPCEHCRPPRPRMFTIENVAAALGLLIFFYATLYVVFGLHR